MKHTAKFAILTIVASGIIALSSCNNPQNDNQNYQDSVNSDEMMVPPDTAMGGMGDTTMDMDTMATP